VSIVTRCRRCGVEYEADRATILAATWRLCPRCRPPAPAGPDDDPPEAT